MFITLPIVVDKVISIQRLELMALIDAEFRIVGKYFEILSKMLPMLHNLLKINSSTQNVE